MSGHGGEKDAGASCNWPRCNSPRTGKCFAWCKCSCHAARARRTKTNAASRACEWCGKPAPESPALLSIWWADYECCSMDCAMLAEGEPVQREARR